MITVQSFRGPDPYFPFLPQIQGMRFQLTNMDPKGETATLSLSQRTPDGDVLVMRVNGVDYIYTWGKKGGLYIILIPDMVSGLQIKVQPAKNDYTFMPIEKLIIDQPKRHQFITEDGRNYMPCIFKFGGKSYVNVGTDEWDQWHYKYYNVDCTGNQVIDGTEERWRPPSAAAFKAFGVILNPPWFSMSNATAHGWHPCFERAIDQPKRIYTPYDIVVSLEENVSCELPLLDKSGTIYDFAYPSKPRFYGRNAYDKADGKITAFGEFIYAGASDVLNMDNNDPILYFWPWIPYMDEIRSFDLLYAGQKNAASALLPVFDEPCDWWIGYYLPNGAGRNEFMAAGKATFSHIPEQHDLWEDNNPSDCACCGSCCGTGHWDSAETGKIGPWTSGGEKPIPIGIIGGKLPIIMFNKWEQQGFGLDKDISTIVEVRGNLPYAFAKDTVYGPGAWYSMCCETDFMNTAFRESNIGMSASNKMRLNQTLKVGDDVIFEGKSELTYGMNYSGEDRYEGWMHIVVDKGIEYPYLTCSGSIDYTTVLMQCGSSQSLYAHAPQDGATYYWAIISGAGSLSSNTGTGVTYTAPADIADCNDTAVIGLYINDERVLPCRKPDCSMVLINTLTVRFNKYADLTKPAYEHNVYMADPPVPIAIGMWGDHDDGIGGEIFCYGQLFDMWHNQYNCLDQQILHYGTVCSGLCDGYVRGSSNANPCGAFWRVNQTVDIRTAAMIAGGCCPQMNQ